MACINHTLFAPYGQRTQWRDSTDLLVLRDAVRRLKRDVELAYHFCRDAEAEAAHEDLIAAEWRLRQAEARA